MHDGWVGNVVGWLNESSSINYKTAGEELDEMVHWLLYFAYKQSNGGQSAGREMPFQGWSIPEVSFCWNGSPVHEWVKICQLSIFLEKFNK